MAADKKDQATGVLDDASTALHAAGDALHDENRDAFARYAEQAAGQVEQFTSAIRDRSVGEILDEAERFARREPGLFIGGAFLLGIAVPLSQGIGLGVRERLAGIHRPLHVDRLPRRDVYTAGP